MIIQSLKLPVSNPPLMMIPLSQRKGVGVGVGAGVGEVVGVGVGVKADATAQYLPPVCNSVTLYPPQTIISVPVQTAVCSVRAEGAFVVLVAVQLSVLGLYLPPVFASPLLLSPPQTIIWPLDHTAV
jgi:hypothetical protein